jgi:glycine hydroxymethyltransferase
VIMGTCRPGDTVLELAGHDGGHRLAEKANQSPLIELQVRPLPFDPQRYNVDADAACALIAKEQPRLIILGASNFLFPHPVRQIAECIAAHSPSTVLAYDASHVFGLIACKTFQDPMGEGSHVAFGSTHKTLPGPQGGLIIANDARLMDAIGIAVYPGIVTNHHLMREPALGAALLEMQDNPDYGPAVVRNAQALGRRLYEHGLDMVGAEHGFTESHTLLLNTRGLGKGKAVAQQLEDVDIIVSYTSLPPALGGEGVRLGSAEPTRLGATEDDMAHAGDLIADYLQSRVDRTRTQAAVREWTSHLNGIAYAGLEQPVKDG